MHFKMKNIYSRTLETTVTKPLIIISVAVAIIGEMLIKVFGPNSFTGDYYSVVSQALLAQHSVMFLFILGAWLMIMVIATSTGLISSEVHEGTLRLLVAKPNTRKQILSAKILGAFTGQVVLMLLSVFTYYVTLFFNKEITAEIFKQMLRYMPGYILYGITVIAISGFSNGANPTNHALTLFPGASAEPVFPPTSILKSLNIL